MSLDLATDGVAGLTWQVARRSAKAARMTQGCHCVSPQSGWSEAMEDEARSRTDPNSKLHRRADAASRLPHLDPRSWLAAIVESSDDAIVSKDLNSIIRSWNSGAERLFGYSAEEAIGRSVTMLMPPDREDEEQGILEKIRRGDRVDHYQTIRRRKDGKLLDISLTVSPIRDEEGVIIGASKIARDIGDQKRFERALLEADRQKNEFLATLAHELRNPLAPIRNSLHIMRLMRGGNSPPDRVQEMLDRQVTHMVRLVDDLLEISRVTMGKIDLRLESVDIGAVIQSAIETSKPVIDAADHTLTVELPESPIIVDGDAVRLSQVVANLLNNAAKYTHPGGKIWVTATRIGDHVEISVCDNGIGLLPEQMPGILEMFTRTEQGKLHSQEGLGIGLALAKRLVEMHGGHIEVESPGVDRGSKFTVWLPVSVRAPIASPSATPADARNLSARRRILVVDDNHDAASSLAMLLTILGSEVEIANDGRGAISAFHNFRPTLALLDLGMPEMNGYEVARYVRSRPEFEDVTLVALTGWGQDEDRRHTREAGFDHHLVKPVDLDALQLLLADLPAKALRFANVTSAHTE
jgi:PAS domain S-box-containing protein